MTFSRIRALAAPSIAAVTCYFSNSVSLDQRKGVPVEKGQHFPPPHIAPAVCTPAPMVSLHDNIFLAPHHINIGPAICTPTPPVPLPQKTPLDHPTDELTQSTDLDILARSAQVMSEKDPIKTDSGMDNVGTSEPSETDKLVATMIGAALGRLCTNPLDVIKTAMQLGDHKSYIDLILSLLKKDGINKGALLGAINDSLVKKAPQWVLLDILTKEIKPMICKDTKNPTLPEATAMALISATIVAAVTVIIVNPLYGCQVTQQTGKKIDSFDQLLTILKTPFKVRNLATGFSYHFTYLLTAKLAMDIPMVIEKNTDSFKNFLIFINPDIADKDCDNIIYATNKFCAGLLAGTLSNPFNGPLKQALLGSKKNLIELLHESKQKGKLWTGVGPNAIRNALLLLITFSTKDTLLEHSVYIKDFFNMAPEEQSIVIERLVNDVIEALLTDQRKPPTF
jgi:hypothetical protein